MPSFRLNAILSAAVLLAATSSARADDWDDCRSSNADRLIAGCNAVIQQSERSPADLSIAHRRRGVWYSRRAMLDRAIEDFDSAVKLTPDSIGALLDRAIAYRRHGNLDGALADSERVIALDAKNSYGFLQRADVRVM